MHDYFAIAKVDKMLARFFLVHELSEQDEVGMQKFSKHFMSNNQLLCYALI